MNKEEIRKDDNYWKGHIQKQNEAIEICKACKYRDKANEYEYLINKIQNKLDYIENMLYETSKGELQRYTPSELFFMRNIYIELLEGGLTNE